jgi:acetoin:2,6-dichlorophenolindophenol oxidoreductase subunit alpha
MRAIEAPSRMEWLSQQGLTAWRSMARIRELEGRLADYSQRGLIRGSTHPSVGMEAVAVGVSLNLTPNDVIASTHRGHGHVLAKGGDPTKLLAELFGRTSGYCRGKGGSMHIAVRELGIFGTNGIVGSSIGIATGAAFAMKYNGEKNIAIAYFGDGGINQGIFHECLNLAAIWRLPCVYVCENNHFAQSAPVEEMVAGNDLAGRSRSFGIPGLGVDGMDVYAVWLEARAAIQRARTGEGPSLLVADTYRFLGHMVGDTEIYRTRAQREIWQLRDPIAKLEQELVDLHLVSMDELKSERAAIAEVITAAERTAVEAELPPAETAFADVYGGQ